MNDNTEITAQRQNLCRATAAVVHTYDDKLYGRYNAIYNNISLFK